MAQSLAKLIRYSLTRAAEAERFAAILTERQAKTELLNLASGWREVAAQYEYVDKLDTFLKTYRHHPANQSRRTNIN